MGEMLKPQPPNFTALPDNGFTCSKRCGTLGRPWRAPRLAPATHERLHQVCCAPCGSLNALLLRCCSWDKPKPRPFDPAHARYLAAALGAEMASRENWGAFVDRWSAQYSGWSGLMNEIAKLAKRMATWVQRKELEHGAPLWGEVFDQYLTLERIADAVFNRDDEPFKVDLKACVVEM